MADLKSRWSSLIDEYLDDSPANIFIAEQVQSETPLKLVTDNGEEKSAVGWQNFKSLVETITANGGKVTIERI